MALGNRRGQTLIETVILATCVLTFLICLESCEKIKPRYNHFKIQRNNR